MWAITKWILCSYWGLQLVGFHSQLKSFLIQFVSAATLYHYFSMRHRGNNKQMNSLNRNTKFVKYFIMERKNASYFTSSNCIVIGEPLQSNDKVSSHPTDRDKSENLCEISPQLCNMKSSIINESRAEKSPPAPEIKYITLMVIIGFQKLHFPTFLQYQLENRRIICNMKDINITFLGAVRETIMGKVFCIACWFIENLVWFFASFLINVEAKLL